MFHFGKFLNTILLISYADAYSEPYQTSMMQCFVKIANILTIFVRLSILDVWQGSE